MDPNSIRVAVREAVRTIRAGRTASEQTTVPATPNGTVTVGSIDPVTYAYRPCGLLDITTFDGPFYLV